MVFYFYMFGIYGYILSMPKNFVKRKDLGFMDFILFGRYGNWVSFMGYIVI